MLTKIKDIKGYVGRGCVWWDGKYDHKPYECVIREVHVNTIHRETRTGVDTDEKVEFVIYCKKLKEKFTVHNIELFDNFKSCYQCIIDYSSFKSLCNLRKYDTRMHGVGKDTVLEELRNTLDNAKATKAFENFDEYKTMLFNDLQETFKRLESMNAKNKIDYDYLKKYTLYGFIQEMMKRYPDLDSRRKPRLSQIVLLENP